MYSLELDTCTDVKNGKITNTEYSDYLKKHKIKYEILEEFGPAGGNPLILYTVEKENLHFLLVRHDAYARTLEQVKEITDSLDDINEGIFVEHFC